ncbi:MAG: chemotaxis protein CheW [candidate division Zixibacteria bacterium]|nr:chemotaxis protein CheW [candidate division Zixibacteria bacterium]
MTDDITKEHTDNLEQMVTFSLGREEFGINILKVQEINRMVEITKVPQTEHYVEGIINLRGKVIPILDLRKKFGMPEREYDNQTRILVVDITKETVGLVVDSVSEVLRVPSDSLEKAPKLTTGGKGGYASAEYIKSVAKLDNRLLIYLDLEKIVSSSSLPAAY